jgi:hypothetical protein
MTIREIKAHNSFPSVSKAKVRGKLLHVNMALVVIEALFNQVFSAVFREHLYGIQTCIGKQTENAAVFC